MLLIGTERGIDRDTEYVLSLLYIHRRVLHPFICGIITRWAYIHGEATGKSIPRIYLRLFIDNIFRVDKVMHERNATMSLVLPQGWCSGCVRASTAAGPSVFDTTWARYASTLDQCPGWH